MLETNEIAKVKVFEARMLHNPKDPQNSNFEVLCDIDGEHVQADSLQELIPKVVHTFKDMYDDEDLSPEDLKEENIVFAEVEVTYYKLK